MGDKLEEIGDTISDSIHNKNKDYVKANLRAHTVPVSIKQVNLSYCIRLPHYPLFRFEQWEGAHWFEQWVTPWFDNPVPCATYEILASHCINFQIADNLGSVDANTRHKAPITRERAKNEAFISEYIDMPGQEHAGK